MNREALIQLRGHIADLPEEKFTYNSYWPADNIREWWHGEAPVCGTAGCVAGHTCVLFHLSSKGARGTVAYTFPSSAAGEFLGLGKADQEALFYVACNSANKDDAVRRLDYLIQHETLAGYNFSGESWWEERVSQPQAYLDVLEQVHRPLPHPPTDPVDASPETPSQILPVPAPRRDESSTGGYAARAIHLQSGQPAESLSSES